MKLSLKPHHLLDIIKLSGFGLSLFTPDVERGHGFHKLGNTVLKNPRTVVSLVVGVDDICKPCRRRINDKCGDRIEGFPYETKEEWNRLIDKRILVELGLTEGDEMTVIEFCQLARRRLTGETIAKVWKERPPGETKRRIECLLSGLEKYLREHTTTY